MAAILKCLLGSRTVRKNTVLTHHWRPRRVSVPRMSPDRLCITPWSGEGDFPRVHGVEYGEIFILHYCTSN